MTVSSCVPIRGLGHAARVSAGMYGASVSPMPSFHERWTRATTPVLATISRHRVRNPQGSSLEHDDAHSRKVLRSDFFSTSKVCFMHRPCLCAKGGSAGWSSERGRIGRDERPTRRDRSLRLSIRCKGRMGMDGRGRFWVAEVRCTRACLLARIPVGVRGRRVLGHPSRAMASFPRFRPCDSSSLHGSGSCVVPFRSLPRGSGRVAPSRAGRLAFLSSSRGRARVLARPSPPRSPPNRVPARGGDSWDARTILHGCPPWDGTVRLVPSCDGGSPSGWGWEEGLSFRHVPPSSDVDREGGEARGGGLGSYLPQPLPFRPFGPLPFRKGEGRGDEASSWTRHGEVVKWGRDVDVDGMERKPSGT